MDQVIRLAISNIDRDVLAIQEELAKGSPKDWAEYRQRVGEVTGMLRAKRELLDALQKLEVA